MPDSRKKLGTPRKGLPQAPGWRVGLPGDISSGRYLVFLLVAIGISVLVAMFIPATVLGPETLDPHELEFMDVEQLYVGSQPESLAWRADAKLVYLYHRVYPIGFERPSSVLFMFQSENDAKSLFVYHEQDGEEVRSGATTDPDTFRYRPEDIALRPLPIDHMVTDPDQVFYAMEQNGAFDYMEDHIFTMEWPIYLTLGPWSWTEESSPIVWRTILSSEKGGSFWIRLDPATLEVVDKVEY